jgi:hypothetical protein
VPDEVVNVIWLLFYEAMHIVKEVMGVFDEDLDESRRRRLAGTTASRRQAGTEP